MSSKRKFFIKNTVSIEKWLPNSKKKKKVPMGFLGQNLAFAIQ